MHNMHRCPLPRGTDGQKRDQHAPKHDAHEIEQPDVLAPLAFYPRHIDVVRRRPCSSAAHCARSRKQRAIRGESNCDRTCGSRGVVNLRHTMRVG